LEWDQRVAREVGHRAHIDAGFDRADGSDRLGKSPAPAPDVSGTNAASSETGCAFLLNERDEAGSAARRAVLARNGDLPASVRDGALLLVTELVTNAVRHAKIGPEQSLRVELRFSPSRVRVEVLDPGTGFARTRAPSRGDEAGGWGLFLVDQIANRSGVRRAASGTCVWFEIRSDA
jgi:anti-sigma regulatory factor (Ser/Thr protein kinase)